MRHPLAAALGCALAVLAAAAPVAAQPVPADLIALEGQPPPGDPDPISILNAPFTDGNGVVGFTGAVLRQSGTDNFVWYGAGPIWFNSDAAPGNTLTGAEGTMGNGDAGEFIYSPSVDGDDAVWTHNGALLVDGQPAPGFPPGVTNTFNSRPQMGPGGQAYWVSGFNETGGTATQGRMLYTSSDATPGNITVVLRSDDIVGGFPIDRPSGIGFDYQFSDDGLHHIQELLLDTGSTADDGVIYVDGAVVAREASPAGGGLPGENWDNFDVTSINVAGDYIFSGDTDGATATDEFIAYNAVIALREGDTVGGVTLTSTASVQAGSINDLGQAVHLWSTGGNEHLFFAADASDLATGVRLLSTGDEIDVDGDMIGDFTVDDFNASTVIGPGLDLADDGFVYVEVDLVPVAPPLGGVLEAIIRLGLPVPNIAATPSPFDFGMVTVGDTVLQAFTVENVGSADLNVSSTQITGPDAGDFMIVSGGGAVVIAPGGQQIVEIEFTPSSVGPKSANFEIASDDPDTPILTVPLTGEGVEPGGGSVLEIPTVSPLGLAALAVLLLGLGLAVLRRRPA